MEQKSLNMNTIDEILPRLTKKKVRNIKITKISNE
jgi:hypothetical protein